MTSLLVASLVVGEGLEKALLTAIAHEVEDPAAILKSGQESPIPLLQLIQQLLSNSTSQQTACLKKVCIYLLYIPTSSYVIRTCITAFCL